MLRSRTSRVLVAPLVAVALVAAACGGDDDSADEPATEEPADEPADDGGEEPADEPADDSAEEPADDGDEPAEEPADDGDEPADDGAEGDEPAEMMTPQRGGTLTYLLEAETDTWYVPSANCAVSCITVLRNVSEPLMIMDDQGEPQPFLLESAVANDDYTEFTLTVREGITFHDGTPLDGEAVKRNLDEMKEGILHGQVLIDMVSTELVDPMTVKVTFSQPYATFLLVIAERTGYMMAPSFWNDPDRTGALAVGTGPFVMTEWTLDEQTVLTANPDYWRTDANGEPLPYLDEIIFRPTPDSATRRATMQAGDADASHDSTGENVSFWRGEWVDGGGGLVPRAAAREVDYLLLNHAVPPFDDPEMRRALALCTNREEYQAFRAPDNQIADGPFAEGDLGYVAEPGFPQFDAEAGNALLDQIGRPDEIVYGSTEGSSNQLDAELFADMWRTNCGLTVRIDLFQQRQTITKMISGDFQVLNTRNHGQGSPGLENVWWNSRFTEGLALNFARITDPELDALLAETQQTLDTSELDRIGQEMTRRFADQVHNIWLTSTEWNNAYQAGVHGIGVVTLPSGGVAQPSIAGRTWLHEAWKES